MTARVTADFWVSAYLARLQALGIPAVLRARGDPTAGTVIVSLATMDGRLAAHQRSWDVITGERRWTLLAAGPEAEVEAVLARARGRDPDLWLIEIEDPKGRTLLDDPSLA